MPQTVARCIICDYEATEEECRTISSCPRCHHKGVPSDPAEDVTIKINWHELRILGIWAENYASTIEDQTPGSRMVVASIADRIQKQFPDKIPLTLSAELRELKKHYPTLETNVDLEDHTFKPKDN
jgi:uncharacterized CHY-type Zn-finger protein